MPGLRAVVLNTNLYASGNMWLTIDNTDNTGQIPWLRDVLGQARAAGEKVLIVAHQTIGHCGQ